MWALKITVLLTCLAAAGCNQFAPPHASRGVQNSAPPQLGASALPALSTDPRVLNDRAIRARLHAERIPDPYHVIDHEAARTVVASLKGVRSNVWVDHDNLLVLVGGSAYRNMATIDRICAALEPLGDTMGAVITVQDMTATTSEGADSLSRNCKLAEGEHTLFTQNRAMNVLDPKVRRVFQNQQPSLKK